MSRRMWACCCLVWTGVVAVAGADPGVAVSGTRRSERMPELVRATVKLQESGADAKALLAALDKRCAEFAKPPKGGDEEEEQDGVGGASRACRWAVGAKIGQLWGLAAVAE